jgi:hypothetical protein
LGKIQTKAKIPIFFEQGNPRHAGYTLRVWDLRLLFASNLGLAILAAVFLWSARHE